MKKTALLTFLACLAGCSTADREIIFSGHLTPRAGTCDPVSGSTLTLLHQAVVFAPNNGTLVLHGALAPGGHVAAELKLPGIDHKPYRLILDATRQDDAIHGSYTTPRCRYDVTLTRTGE